MVRVLYSIGLPYVLVSPDISGIPLLKMGVQGEFSELGKISFSAQGWLTPAASLPSALQQCTLSLPPFHPVSLSLRLMEMCPDGGG